MDGNKEQGTDQQRAVVNTSADMVWDRKAVVSCWKPAKEPHQFHMRFKAAPAVQ